MARILVKTPNKVKTHRLWCNTADVWVTKSMTAYEMVKYLSEEHFEPHTEKEAIDRVNRKGYDADHLEWLNRFYDSKYKSLCYYDKKHRG